MIHAANVTRIKTLLRTDRSVVRGKATRDLSPAKALAVDQAYDDYCDRIEQGEDVDMAAFCESHGDCESELLRCIELHRFLDDNPDALDLLEPIPWPSVGDVFADKTILTELGRGGIGRVYLAQESKLPRKVVLKVSAFENGEAVRLSRLEHENIVPIYCIDEDLPTGLSAICMPFLGRHTLHDVLDLTSQDEERPAAWAEIESKLLHAKGQEDTATKPHSYTEGVLKLGRDIASALQHCHDQRIYHLDLKPSNILFTSDGTPMLIDFGVSTDDEHREVFGGTKPYMSPEQIRSFLFPVSPEIPAPDGKSDVYSLAVMLVQLLTGKHPFAEVAFHGTAHQLLLCQQQLDAETLLARGGLPKGVVRVLGTCLSQDPAERPTAAEMSRMLRGLSEKRTNSRRRALLAAGIAGVMAAAVGVWAQDTAELKYLRGLRHLANEQWDAAIDVFGSAIEKAPTNLRYLSARASAYCSRDVGDDLVLARDDYLEAFRSSNRPELSACVAYCDAKVGRYVSAITYASRAADKGYRNAAVRNIRAHARSKVSADERKLAVADFLNLTSDYPNFQPGWCNLAMIYFGQAVNNQEESIEKGIEAVERAFAAGPEGPVLLYCQASLLDLQIQKDPEGVDDVPAQQAHIRDLLVNAVDMGLNPQIIIGEKRPPFLFKSILDTALKSQLATATPTNLVPNRPLLIHPLDNSNSKSEIAVVTD